eukprot:318902-Pyramimonas_sp.AAC.1
MVERWWLDTHNIVGGFLIPGVHPVFLLDANAEVGSRTSPHIGDVEAVVEHFSGTCMRAFCHRFQVIAPSTFIPAPPGHPHHTHVHTNGRTKKGSTTSSSPRTGE